MEKLTRRQDDVLKYIKEFMVSHGYPPTIREIGSALGISSPATIHSHLLWYISWSMQSPLTPFISSSCQES